MQKELGVEIMFPLQDVSGKNNKNKGKKTHSSLNYWNNSQKKNKIKERVQVIGRSQINKSCLPKSAERYNIIITLFVNVPMNLIL